MPDLKVTGAEDLRKLAGQLERANLVPELEREFHRIGAPIVADVRAQQASIPSKGRKHTGLRAALMRATGDQVTVSRQDVRLRIETNPARMPPGQRAMPVAVEKEAFIHPVYGHEQVRVVQRGHPYLRNTVRRHLPQARAAVERAADTVALKLTRR